MKKRRKRRKRNRYCYEDKGVHEKMKRILPAKVKIRQKGMGKIKNDGRKEKRKQRYFESRIKSLLEAS